VLEHHVGAADGVGLVVQLLAEDLELGLGLSERTWSSATDNMPPVPQAGSKSVRTTPGPVSTSSSSAKSKFTMSRMTSRG